MLVPGTAIETRFPEFRVVLQNKPEVVESAKKVRPLYNLSRNFDEDDVIVLENQPTRMPTPGYDDPMRLLPPTWGRTTAARRGPAGQGQQWVKAYGFDVYDEHDRRAGEDAGNSISRTNIAANGSSC